MAGPRQRDATRVKRAVMSDERWQRIVQIMDEAYKDYLTGMAVLRKHVVMDLKHKLDNGEVLDRPDLEQSLPRERPTAPARRRRARGRRKRRS